MDDTVLVLVGAVVAALALAGAVVAVAVTVLRRQRAEDARPSAPVPGGWTDVGTDDGVVGRLGLQELFEGLGHGDRGAGAARCGGYPVVVAVTPGRGWANERGKANVTVRISGASYTLCALRLPGPLPSFNLLSEGRGGADRDGGWPARTSTPSPASSTASGASCPQTTGSRTLCWRRR